VGSGYLHVVFAGEEALDSAPVSDFPSLVNLLARLAPVINMSQRQPYVLNGRHGPHTGHHPFSSTGRCRILCPP